MKKLIFLTILFCFSATLCFAQKIVKIEKPNQPTPILTESATETSGKEWKTMNESLRAEDWEKSVVLASQLMNRIKVDNERKQLAQLRYFYLFSLAGKIAAYSEARKPVEEESAREELDKAAESFIGKELVMPPRQFLANCKQVLNYICKVKNTDNALRVAATNKAGTTIHSFEIVLFDQKIDLKEFIEKETFLGGILAKVEFNENKTNLWIMRLSFVKGFVRVVVDK